ncbi:hypothetical protein [Haloferula sp. A504]|uniref:hypothetical protein n=1 Tax=Haloferula sp. A504 TaxID=3373601 RepID=UPI0031C6A582|nr:hypothetical protein [Verrucomicrobiaceae bacterium E54]
MHEAIHQNSVAACQMSPEEPVPAPGFPDLMLLQFGIRRELPPDGLTPSPIPLSAIYGVGKKTSEKLQSCGLDSAGQLAALKSQEIQYISHQTGLSEVRLTQFVEAANDLFIMLSRERLLDEMLEEGFESTPDASSNRSLITPDVLFAVDKLISGEHEPNVNNFHSLCSLAEAVVFFEEIETPYTPSEAQAFEQGDVAATFKELLEGPELTSLSSSWGKAPVTDILEGQSVIKAGSQLSDASKDVGLLSIGPFFFEGRNPIGPAIVDEEQIRKLWSYSISSDLPLMELVGSKLMLRHDSDHRSSHYLVHTMVYPARLLATCAEKQGISFCCDLAHLPLLVRSKQPPRRVHDMFKHLDNRYQSLAIRLYESKRLVRMAIPMLTAILLQKSKSREQIPLQLLKLREEFSDIRAAVTDYEDKLKLCETLGDFQDLDSDLQAAMSAVLRHTMKRRSRIVRRIFDVVKSASISGIVSEFLERMLTRDEDRIAIGRFQSFLNIWQTAKQIPDYDRLLEKTFGVGLSQNEWRIYMDIANGLQKVSNDRGFVIEDS